jgi:hypothetical protein
VLSLEALEFGVTRVGEVPNAPGTSTWSSLLVEVARREVLDDLTRFRARDGFEDASAPAGDQEAGERTGPPRGQIGRIRESGVKANTTWLTWLKWPNTPLTPP